MTNVTIDTTVLTENQKVIVLGVKDRESQIAVYNEFVKSNKTNKALMEQSQKAQKAFYIKLKEFTPEGQTQSFTTLEFHGNFKPFTLGVSKATALVENVEEIRKVLATLK